MNQSWKRQSNTLNVARQGFYTISLLIKTQMATTIQMRRKMILTTVLAVDGIMIMGL